MFCLCLILIFSNNKKNMRKRGRNKTEMQFLWGKLSHRVLKPLSIFQMLQKHMFDTLETSLTSRCISSVRKLHLMFVTFSSGNQKMAQRVINHCLNSAGKEPVVFSTETLRLRFGHLTANGKHWFAVSGFTLSVQDSRVVARSCNVCLLFSSIL